MTKRLSGSTATILSSMETRPPSTVTPLKSLTSRTRRVKISGRLTSSRRTFTKFMVRYTLRDSAQPLINCPILCPINISHSNQTSKFCLSWTRKKANRIKSSSKTFYNQHLHLRHPSHHSKIQEASGHKQDRKYLIVADFARLDNVLNRASNQTRTL